jgi:hypothetical protein
MKFLRPFLCSYLLIFASTQLWAWNENTPLGARSAALANASVTLSDVWSAQQNQAGLGYLKKISAGVSFENRFLLKDLATKSLVAAVPTKYGVIGLSVSSFGNCKLYSENKYGLAYAKAFGDVFSMGIQFDYLSTNIAENYGKSGVIAAEAGIQAKLAKNLYIGSHIFNPTRALIAKYNDERAPTIIRLGLRYEFSKVVFTSIEVVKDIEKKPAYKVGIEYMIIKQFYLRVGVASNPFYNAFGFGANLKKFKLDVSTSYHQTLGYVPQLSMSVELDAFKKKEIKK